MGLDFGADDYVVKPFLPKELEARIRSLLRRNNSQTQSKKTKKKIKFGSVVVDLNKRQVFNNSQSVKLTNIEYSLLELLINNSGIELSRKTILDNIWGYTPERYVDTRIVDVHISRLRAKLEIEPMNPDLILTVRGKGYTFQKY
jgi:OmpR family response regulator RpaB